MAGIDVIPIVDIQYARFTGNGETHEVKTKYPPFIVLALRSGSSRSEWYFVFLKDNAEIEEIMDNGSSFEVRDNTDVEFYENKVIFKNELNETDSEYFVIIFTKRYIETYIRVR